METATQICSWKWRVSSDLTQNNATMAGAATRIARMIRAPRRNTPNRLKIVATPISPERNIKTSESNTDECGHELMLPSAPMRTRTRSTKSRPHAKTIERQPQVGNQVPASQLIRAVSTRISPKHIMVENGGMFRCNKNRIGNETAINMAYFVSVLQGRVRRCRRGHVKGAGPGQVRMAVELS